MELQKKKLPVSLPIYYGLWDLEKIPISLPLYRPLHLKKIRAISSMDMKHVSNLRSVLFLLSFDVVGLFPHVPLIPTVEHIEELLREAATPFFLTQKYIHLLQIKRFFIRTCLFSHVLKGFLHSRKLYFKRPLLQSCFSPNVCQFNQLVYSPPDDIGIPIGSPLGCLISEVPMEKFELELFWFNHPLLKYIALSTISFVYSTVLKSSSNSFFLNGVNTFL